MTTSERVGGKPGYPVLDTPVLDRFRIDPDAPAAPVVRKGKGTQKTWVPPERHEFANGYVLAWDQSITAAGWVLLDHTDGSDQQLFAILEAGSFGEKAESGEKGWEGTLRRAQRVQVRMAAVLERLSVAGGPQPVVVHEAPPTGGGKMSRPESSILGAFALRLLIPRYGLTLAPMITPQTHKRLICGNGTAKKPVEHAALKALVDRCGITGYEWITNEAKRDSMCVALAHLLRSGS